MLQSLATALWAPVSGRKARETAIPQARRQADTMTDLHRFINGLRIATVTTTDTQGMMHSCPVTTLTRKFDGEIWLPAYRGTAVVEHLRERPNALVTFIDGMTDRCLTLHGIADFNVDREAARSFWHRGLAPWFSQGPDDPALVLIRVKVVSADFWE